MTKQQCWECSSPLYSHSLSLYFTVIQRITKTAEEATSGAVYLLMFFPLRYNGNGGNNNPPPQKKEKREKK